MNEFIHHVSDATFETRSAQVRRSGPGGLLGGVVRAVQGDRAGARRSGQGVLGQAQGGEGQRRREPGDSEEIRHPRHTDADAVQNGNVEAQKVGSLSKSQLTAFLDSNI